MIKAKEQHFITNKPLLDKIVQKGKGNLVFASDFQDLSHDCQR